jgi:hypothetical protein
MIEQYLNKIIVPVSAPLIHGRIKHTDSFYVWIKWDDSEFEMKTTKQHFLYSFEYGWWLAFDNEREILQYVLKHG